MIITSHYTEYTAKKFKRFIELSKLSILIYRDLPEIIKKYCITGKALDFGCGPGLSSNVMADLGFDIIGVDINKNMIKEALSDKNNIPFILIDHGKIPFDDNLFDLVFSSMVLLEMQNLEIMQEAVNEITRTLKPNSIFIAIVGSENFHKYNWLNKNNINNKKCQNLISGDEIITYSETLDITFRDYYYTDNDYRNIFTRAGLNLLEAHKALGAPEDGVTWDLERSINPFTHYICQKI